MNAADAIAFAALMIGLISIFGGAADVYKRRLAFKERKLELAAKESADQAAHFAAQAQKLEARVRALERIATDREGQGAAALAAEIEDLRTAAAN
jgi:predicted metalloprotease